MMNSTLHKSLLRGIAREKWRENVVSRRSIVSQSFQAKEAWQSRLAAPVFQKIKMGEYFVELDKKFSNEMKGSAVDVDIFANNVQSDTQAEHMEELLHKLRRTPHTVHTSDSTHHAAVRAMLDHGEVENLVKMLDDRLNYGVFLDEYSAILTLDKLLEMGDVKAAARCASQLMIQEETFPLPVALGNLSCWRYFASGREDPWYYQHELQDDPNPDEVVRVRVRVVPNNHRDDHFDLRDPERILGRTLVHLNRGRQDVLGRSLLILGNYLYGNLAEAGKLLAAGETARPVLDALAAARGESEEDDAMRSALAAAQPCELDVDAALVQECLSLDLQSAEELVRRQQQIYIKWNKNREEELERQYQLMQREGRIQHVEQTRASLRQEEEKLFFFDNLDSLEMEKTEKLTAWKRTLPRSDWNMRNYRLKDHYKKSASTDGVRKEARWERREKKLGPAK